MLVRENMREEKHGIKFGISHQLLVALGLLWVTSMRLLVPMRKKGGVQANIRKCLQFNNWINECSLMEVTTWGIKFTWRGPQWNGRDRVFKKLDRVLCNVSWRLRYHEGFAKVLPRVQSDHHPIILLTEGEPNVGRNRPFKFEAA